MVHKGHVKTRAIVDQIRLSKRFSFEHIRWYSNTKADKYSTCYLSLPPWGQVVYFYEADCYCIILSHYSYAKVLLKNFTRFAGKCLCRSLFLISQYPATFLITDSNINAFLWTLQKCQEHHFYVTLWNSWFCIYGTYL